MGFDTFKTLPNILKPATLLFIILQTFFMCFPHLQAFGWFPITTTILQLIFTIIAFVVFYMDLPAVVQAPMWPLAEMLYAAIFCVCSAVNFFYFLVNIFKNFNFFYILATIAAGALTLAWGLDAFIWMRQRNGGSTPSMPSYNNNQATAQPAPGGAAPFPGGPAPFPGTAAYPPPGAYPPPAGHQSPPTYTTQGVNPV